MGPARTGRNVDPRKRLPLEDSIPSHRAAAPVDKSRAITRRAAPGPAKNRLRKRNRGLIYWRNGETVQACGPKPAPPAHMAAAADHRTASMQTQ